MTSHVPAHITGLCIFAVINLTILLNVSLVEASVIVLNASSWEIAKFEDAAARFGPRPSEPLRGYVVHAVPAHGCKDIQSPPNISTPLRLPWIVLIEREQCEFDVKVLNAQNAGYIAAIIHNVNSDDLTPMGSGSALHDKIQIPSVLIGKSDGYYMWDNICAKLNYTILIDWPPQFNTNILLPFAIVMGICFLLMVVLLVAKWIQGCRRERRGRLSTKHLKKLPIKKFKKGDQYDVCAICLDEYEDGEKIRVLPCAHAYHIKCIDHWLTKRKRTCPICKRKLFPGDHDTDSESETESESENEAPSEVTPLLNAQNANRNPRRGYAERNNASDSSTVDTVSDHSVSVGPSTSFHQSSVDVHDSSGYGGSTRARDVVANTESSDSDGEHQLGAVGDLPNQSIQIVDDHYQVVAAPRPADDTDTDTKPQPGASGRGLRGLQTNRNKRSNNTEEV